MLPGRKLSKTDFLMRGSYVISTFSHGQVHFYFVLVCSIIFKLLCSPSHFSSIKTNDVETKESGPQKLILTAARFYC